MIGYLRGTVSHVLTDTCYLDVHGVGYRLYISESTRQQLSLGEEVQLFTYLNVREDALQLYAFFTEEEYELFLKLISVSGIGPKVGIGILSGITPEAFKLAIASGDVHMLIKLPGIGKKSAERLILELKDKLGSLPSSAGKATPVVTPVPQGLEKEVLMALQGLGYALAEVQPVVQELASAHTTVPALLKASLAELGKRR